MKLAAYVAPLIAIWFVSASHAAGQVITLPDVEYGDVSELVGTNRVFVDSDDYKAREHILREIAKHSRLRVVGRIEDAEFVLKFGSPLTSPTAPSSNDFTGGEGAMTVYGDMVAYRLTEGPARLRICWFTRKKQVHLNAAQLVGQFFLRKDDPKSNLLGLFLNLIPRGRWKFGFIHLSRAPEVNATRDFLKALRRAERMLPGAEIAGAMPTTHTTKVLSANSASKNGEGMIAPQQFNAEQGAAALLTSPDDLRLYSFGEAGVNESTSVVFPLPVRKRIARAGGVRLRRGPKLQGFASRLRHIPSRESRARRRGATPRTHAQLGSRGVRRPRRH
jgi:hypothetical protein